MLLQNEDNTLKHRERERDRERETERETEREREREREMGGGGGGDAHTETHREPITFKLVHFSRVDSPLHQYGLRCLIHVKPAGCKYHSSGNCV